MIPPDVEKFFRGAIFTRPLAGMGTLRWPSYEIGLRAASHDFSQAANLVQAEESLDRWYGCLNILNRMDGEEGLDLDRYCQSAFSLCAAREALGNPVQSQDPVGRMAQGFSDEARAAELEKSVQDKIASLKLRLVE